MPGTVVAGLGSTRRFHAARARRKLKTLFPQLGRVPFELFWTGTLAFSQDHLPRIVRVGRNAMSIHTFNGRRLGAGTVFSGLTPEYLKDGDLEVFAVAVVDRSTESFAGLRAAYFEFGSDAKNAISDRWYVGAAA